MKKTVENLVLPHDSSSIYIAVQDHVYDEIPLTSNPEDEDIQHRTYGFVVDDWIRTKEISNQLKVYSIKILGTESSALKL